MKTALYSHTFCYLSRCNMKSLCFHANTSVVSYHIQTILNVSAQLATANGRNNHIKQNLQMSSLPQNLNILRDQNWEVPSVFHYSTEKCLAEALTENPKVLAEIQQMWNSQWHHAVVNDRSKSKRSFLKPLIQNWI